MKHDTNSVVTNFVMLVVNSEIGYIYCQSLFCMNIVENDRQNPSPYGELYIESHV